MDSKKKKKTTIKKFLDIDGLSHLINLFTSFVASYAAPKNHNHDTTYAAKSHTHDDRYYTEAEVDNKLGGKAPTSHTHSIANVTNLQSQLDGKQPKGSYASSSHTHTWSQITGRPSIPPALTYMPVGYVYISWSSTSPASLFGGSWTAITGRFPYFNAGTRQGGSNSHSLSVNELPSHNHRYNNHDWLVYIGKAGAGGDNAPQQFVPQGSYCLMGGQGRMLAANISGVNTGGNAAHNNMPSYQTLYAWRRTA